MRKMAERRMCRTWQGSESDDEGDYLPGEHYSSYVDEVYGGWGLDDA